MSKNKGNKRAKLEVLGYCSLCGKAIHHGSSFDFKQVEGSMKAVCKGGCE